MFSQGQSAFQVPSSLRARPASSLRSKLDEDNQSNHLTSISPDSLDSLVDSLPYSTINTRRTFYKMHSRTSRRPAVGRVLPTRADKTKKIILRRVMAFTLSGSFSNGGGIERRELGLRTRFTSEQHYYQRDGGLIIGNFAHSSRAAAIF